MCCVIAKLEKQFNTHTHAEWEEWERLSLEDTKFHYVHGYYYLVRRIYTLIFYFQMSPGIYYYDELQCYY